MGVNVHGYIVGDDGLLLELKLLEHIGLEDLLDLFRRGRDWRSAVWHGAHGEEECQIYSRKFQRL